MKCTKGFRRGNHKNLPKRWEIQSVGDAKMFKGEVTPQALYLSFSVSQIVSNFLVKKTTFRTLN